MHPAHEQANACGIKFVDAQFAADLPATHDEDAIGQCAHFFQFHRHQQDRGHSAQRPRVGKAVTGIQELHHLASGQVQAVQTAPLNQQDELTEIWQALVLGLGDYVNKNGFNSVILGLSGGIDSAVCAALAVDAIGADRVFGVSLPSKYSSDHSVSDAQDLADRLGISLRSESIANIVDVAETQLGLSDLAAENLQARVRGLILMGLSNQEGHLTLTTGNKTEIAGRLGFSCLSAFSRWSRSL